MLQLFNKANKIYAQCEIKTQFNQNEVDSKQKIITAQEICLKIILKYVWKQDDILWLTSNALPSLQKQNHTKKKEEMSINIFSMSACMHICSIHLRYARTNYASHVTSGTFHTNDVFWCFSPTIIPPTQQITCTGCNTLK